MHSVLWSKKAFLYFGGAFVILLGGAVILSAPYHYIGFVAVPPDACSFQIWAGRGYYNQLEIAVSGRPGNASTITVNFSVVNNETLSTVVVNMTLTSSDMVPGTNPPVFEKRAVVDLEPGNYIVYADNSNPNTYFDLGLTQLSDSRLFIVTGGSMNIIGLVMCMSGYFVAGTFLPTGEETIVGWGYEEKEKEQA